MTIPNPVNPDTQQRCRYAAQDVAKIAVYVGLPLEELLDEINESYEYWTDERNAELEEIHGEGGV